MDPETHQKHIFSHAYALHRNGENEDALKMIN